MKQQDVGERFLRGGIYGGEDTKRDLLRMRFLLTIERRQKAKDIVLGGLREKLFPTYMTLLKRKRLTEGYPTYKLVAVPRLFRSKKEADTWKGEKPDKAGNVLTKCLAERVYKPVYEFSTQLGLWAEGLDDWFPKELIDTLHYWRNNPCGGCQKRQQGGKTPRHVRCIHPNHFGFAKLSYWNYKIDREIIEEYGAPSFPREAAGYRADGQKLSFVQAGPAPRVPGMEVLSLSLCFDPGLYTRDEFEDLAMRQIREHMRRNRKAYESAGFSVIQSLHAKHVDWLVRFRIERETTPSVAREITVKGEPYNKAKTVQEAINCLAKILPLPSLKKGRPKK